MCVCVCVPPAANSLLELKRAASPECSWAFPSRPTGVCWRYLEGSSVVGHGAAHPLVAAVLLDVSDPLLTLRHDLYSLQVEMFVDHLQTQNTMFNHRERELYSY